MKKLLSIIVGLCLVFSLAACGREASKVSRNVSKEADNFNVTRRLAVINARSDKPIFELIGRFSVSNGVDELQVIVETDEGVYKKHMVYLNDWTIYVIEDVSGAYVDPYHYEVNFLPEMIVPVTITQND